jgi:hypothetical protein
MHWSFPDTVNIGDEAERLEAFERTAEHLQRRILYFVSTLESEM